MLDGRFGLRYRSSDTPEDSFIMARISFAYDTGVVGIPPVYVRGDLAVGAEGLYEIDSKMFRLTAYVHGGVEGGITAFKKYFPIIHLMLEAQGEITNQTGSWMLNAQVGIYYSLDLWLDEIEGGVTWYIQTPI